MVHLKGNLGVEFSAFLNRKGLVLEFFQRLIAGQVKSDVGFAGSFNGEGLDDAFSWVFGVANRLARIQTQGGFPSVERFVVLVYPERRELFSLDRWLFTHI